MLCIYIFRHTHSDTNPHDKHDTHDTHAHDAHKHDTHTHTHTQMHIDLYY
jgi:hypothetical protein